MPNIIKARFKLRSGTTADWLAHDEVLANAEVGEEVTTSGERLRKVGNGVDKWSALPYRVNSPVDRSTAPTDGQTIVFNEATGLLEWKDAGKTYQAGTNITIDNPTSATPTINSDAGLQINNRVDTYGDLPSPPPEGAGASYLVQADGLIYVWDGAAWPANGDGITLTTLTVSTDIYKAGSISIPSLATGLLRTQGIDGKFYLIPVFEIREDSAYEAVIKTDAPYAFYPLDDPLTGSARDISGNYRNASYKGSPTQAAQIVNGGVAVGCTALNGTSQYIDASVAAGAMVNSYSIELWIKPATSGTTDNYLDVNQNATGGNVIYCSNTDVGFYAVPNTNRGTLLYGTTLVGGSIYLVTITADKLTNTFTLYLNDTQVDQKVITGTTWPTAAEQILLGHDMYRGSNYGYFAGVESCVAFYDKVLTPTQVAAHYAAGS